MPKKTISTNTLEQIGGRLKDLRNKLEMTTYDVAEFFSVNNGTVSRWETGKTEPPIGYLLYIAEKTHCDLNYVLLGDPKNTSPTESLSDEDSEPEVQPTTSTNRRLDLLLIIQKLNSMLIEEESQPEKKDVEVAAAERPLMGGKDADTANAFKAGLKFYLDKLKITDKDTINSWNLDEDTLEKILNGQQPSAALMEEIAEKMNVGLLEMLLKGQEMLSETASIKAKLKYLDHKLITDIITHLDNFLIKKKNTLPSKNKAEIIISSYEIVVKSKDYIAETGVTSPVMNPIFSELLDLAVDEAAKKTG